MMLMFSQEFVAALRDVKEAVDDIYKEVSSMNEVCVDMKTRLQATKSETRHLIHQTNSLQNQRYIMIIEIIYTLFNCVKDSFKRAVIFLYFYY